MESLGRAKEIQKACEEQERYGKPGQSKRDTKGLRRAGEIRKAWAEQKRYRRLAKSRRDTESLSGAGKKKAAASQNPAVDAFGRRELTTGQKRAWAAGFAVFLIVLWEVLSLAADNSFILPGPAAVIRSLIRDRVVIFTVHLPATMEVVLIGGALSIFLGVLFAVLMDLFPSFKRALYPILTVTQTIPVMCVAPVFILWLGYTVQMRVLVVILVNFFPVTINLYDGLNSTAEDKTELLETFGASRLQKFFLLRLPTSLPYLFSALHVAVPWAVVGAAVSEWLGAQNGLGTYSRYCMMKLDAAGLLAPLLVLTVVALLLDRILTVIEHRVIRW